LEDRAKTGGNLIWLVIAACTMEEGQIRRPPELTPSDTDEDKDTGQRQFKPFTVAVVADLNSSYGSTTYTADVHDAVSRIVELSPDLVLSAGDMVAGQKLGLDYEGMWEGFHEAVTDPLEAAGIPLAVSPGNHDASAYSGYEEEREIYWSEWVARRPDLDFIDDSNYPFYYSFAFEDAIFISIDATKVGPLDKAQMAWLEQQISAEYPHRILFSHVPLYPFSEGQETSIIGDEALEDLVVDKGVELWISGHHHAYYPGRRKALRLVGMACLGTGTRPLIGESENSPTSFVLMEVGNGTIGVEAYSGDDFTELVLRDALPSSIGSGDTTIWRDDL
jgi:hypothetical protein